MRGLTADAEEDRVDGARLGLARGIGERHGRELVAVLVQLGQLRLQMDVDQRMRSIRRIRYADIVLPRLSPRTSMVTRAVAFAKLRTAWPAELPAPTITTLCPAHCAASLRPAP